MYRLKLFNRSRAKKGGLLIGLVSTLIGATILAPMMYLGTYTRANASQFIIPVQQSAPVNYATTIISGNPVRIEIPSLNINLAIAKGSFDENAKTWTLSKDKAYFADISSVPNDAYGNTYIYGHNINEVFGRINSVTSSAVAHIITDNGYRFSYIFLSVQQTTPEDVAVLVPSDGKPALLIQTCSGTFSQYRQIYTFTFKDVIKL